MNRLESKDWYYLDLFGKEEGMIGLLLVHDPYSGLPFADGTDRLVLIVRNRVSPQEEIEHWLRDDVRIQVRRVTLDTLNRWVIHGDRTGVGWLVQGELLSDETGRIAELRHFLEEWPGELRERKLLVAFSRFIMSYMLAKTDLQNGQVPDAYGHILACLRYWSNICLIEQGMLPEMTVWEQMRLVNPGIYKLYEELTDSPETVEKRVQLVVLACEFSIQTKMRSSCSLLLRVLASRAEPWSVAELREDSRLHGLPLDLTLLLRKLVHRGLAREVAKPIRGRGSLKLELRYAAGDERP
ncbi:hypothetical protein GE107_25485 [Cohnella sp. CFH 77786]|uniref:nucleotidyltransferase-like protein n=1 Tax=Cohnella sp. CFH 77786 TaxID=2662265 RepID=UPI001C60885E|nr:nucleotidyltransferase-like protein [Cohnella sp. CFH 77786]MBW5449383.1 hypothetical protein [Cohnella sp. CFH 77786]